MAETKVMRVLLFPFVLALGLAGCKPAPPPAAVIDPPAVVLPAGVSELTPAEATEWITRHPEGILVDLRMAEEVAREGRIQGSRNLDFLKPKTQDELSLLHKDKPALLYCALGGRSRQAAVKMHELGFPQISILKGGLNAWLTEGRPVIK